MSSPIRRGRVTTMTLYPEAFEVLRELSPGPRGFGKVVSRLLLTERERQEARQQERERIAQEIREAKTPALAAR